MEGSVESMLLGRREICPETGRSQYLGIGMGRSVDSTKLNSAKAKLP